MDIEASLKSLTALCIALSGLIPGFILVWKKVSRQERRLALFWRGRRMRGMIEALQKKLVVEQVGPEDGDPENVLFTVAVVSDVAKAFEPIKKMLVEMRAKHKDASEDEFCEAIEERFGPWLTRHICSALGVNDYACVIMAQSIANGIEPVPRPSSHD